MNVKTPQLIKCTKEIKCKCNKKKGSLSRKNDTPPSRSNSKLEARKKRPPKKTTSPRSGPSSRSSSVPPRPFTRRNIKTIPHNYLTTVQKNSREIEYIHEDKEFPSTTNEDIVIMNNNNSDPNKKRNLKTPVPTPRAVPQNESTEYEYLRFSLRITEDIIRNNLYNPKDLERVFNSHIEANRDRLDMKKMSEQIERLQTEINVKKIPEETENANESCQINLLNHIIHRHEITEDQMERMTESELQYVITGILNSDQLDVCSLCMRENMGCFKEDTERRQNNIDKINEFMASKNKSTEVTTPNESVVYNEFLDASDPASTERESSATDDEDVKSEKRGDPSVNSEKRSVEGKPSPTKEKSASFSSNKSVAERSFDNEQEDIACVEEIINYQELSRIEKDPTQIKTSIAALNYNKVASSLRKSLEKELEEYVRRTEEIIELKESIMSPPTADETELQVHTFPESNSGGSSGERRQASLEKKESDKKEAIENLSFTTKNLVNIEPESALKKNSDTQTVLERYIIEKSTATPENSRGSMDKKIQTTVRPDMGLPVPSTDKSNSSKKQSSSSANAFVETINSAVANQMNDLYKPVPEKSFPVRRSKDSSPRAKTSNDKVNSLSKINKERAPLDLSEGEIPPPIARPPHRAKHEERNILKQLEKYETKNSEPAIRRTSITSYELSIFTEQCETYIPKFHRKKFFPDISTQTSLTSWTPPVETLLSDGEVKNYTSESDDTKTDVT